MQIPSSAGVLANSVLPVTPTHGGLMSPVSETAGSASFPPVEAVSNTIASRDISAQRPQPDFAPENNGSVNITSYSNSSVSNTPTEGDAQDSGQRDGQRAEQKPAEQPDQVQEEADQKRAGREQQQQQQQDLDVIRELTLRDDEVRAHEQAHSAVGGQYAGSADFIYQRGPDGVNYAVGGEVSIDVGVIAGDPQATLEKMLLVQRAALAPAEPSSQDRQVAALASQQANQARADIIRDSQVGSSSSRESEQGNVNNDIEPVVNTSAQTISNRDTLQVVNDRMAKINEILLAVSQNQLSKVSGQLLDDVV
jgi:hypothetical protein